MKLYALRFLLSDGDYSHPWTTWAPDMSEAANKVKELAINQGAVEATIRERPSSEGVSFWGHPEELGHAVVEHSDVRWSREFSFDPLDPLPIEKE